MPERDGTQEFLESLPEIEPGQSFCFACHPGVQCFNECCADLNLMLTPYDLLRLRRALGLSSEECVTKHCAASQFPDSGFPMLHLNMTEKPGRPCPFVRQEGCSVYPDRPGACRTYPVGRASRIGGNGEVQEQFFLVQEAHCKGFGEQASWTTDTWLQDQGLQEYNRENDRYMRLIARQKAAGQPLSPRHANMCLLALYQPDRFQQFVQDMKVFGWLQLSEEEQERILSDEKACLDFAYDWMELLIFGKSERLQPKA